MLGINDYYFVQLADFNGDGKIDIYMDANNGDHIVWLNNGDGTFPTGSDPYVFHSGEGYYLSGNCMRSPFNATKSYIGDFNGDGKLDIDLFNRASKSHAIWLNKGDGKFSKDTNPYYWNLSGDGGLCTYLPSAILGDFNGDAKADIYVFASVTGTQKIWLNNGLYPDLLSSISNGLGGTTTLTYKSSTAYPNTQLPFPVYTISSVTTNDGHSTSSNLYGISSTTTYYYKYGFFHLGERDFRGFNYVKVTGPAGPNGEQRVTETWFHQGNETNVLSETISPDELRNLANVGTGAMKGKPYRTRISDGAGHMFSEVTTAYKPNDLPPLVNPKQYFNPPMQVDSSICDYGSCGLNTTTIHGYDNHGNVTTQQFKDNGTLYRTVERKFFSDETNWLVGLPLQELVTNSSGTLVSGTYFCYDGTINCVSNSLNQNPTRGNMTSMARLYQEKKSGETDPEVRMTYDGYGNLATTQDPKGNITKFGYDSTQTFIRTSTTPPTPAFPAGLTTTTLYYDIDVPSTVNNGLYGQVQSITDPNNAQTLFTYDTFGRKTHTTMPDGTWQHWYYSPLGTVGSQYVTLSDINGLSSSTYFDGLGRPYLEHRSGPGGKTISVATEYNTTGTVKQTSLPYFEGIEIRDIPYTKYTYDPIGRTTSILNPDGTSVSACYSLGVTVGIDADKHRKRETRDSLGRLVKVEEYQFTYDTCSIDGGTLYAKTRYDYDVLGNLVTVTDDANNITTIHYDSLGRKKDMTDPDMGFWMYQYDANNNLYKQTDAKNQTITFQYDELNRLFLKTYPTGTVSFTYDVAPDTSFQTAPIGRLSKMTDASGATKYFYDNMGRSTAARKTVDGKDYTVKVGYDNGRMASITYPDNETVRYSYGTGNELNTVRNSSDYMYAYYPAADYTALGQPRTLINGNGVTTTYQYYPQNSRLQNITTSYFDKQLLNLTYDYYDGGNIKTITDPDQPAITSPSESVIYTYGGPQPHFVTSTTDGRTYTPDLNGNMKNMISNGTRTIDYDYDNMPTSVTTNGITTSFVYDGAGARVKKIDSNGSTIYIGQLYECRADVCTKYIFANGNRIASNFNGDILYYHKDHLGSTRIVTNDTGANQESSYYYPFGAIQSDTGAISVNHKYTSQEFDDETGLYFYNARYYNPELGRFISADKTVPAPFNPQSLNRYSYVVNNPLIYTDPNGYSWHTRDWEAAAVVVATVVATVLCDGCTAGYGALAGEAVGGYVAYQSGGNVLNGVVIGGIIGGTLGYELTPATNTTTVLAEGYGQATIMSDGYNGYLIVAKTAPAIDWGLAATQAGTALVRGGIAFGIYEVGAYPAGGLSGAGGNSGGGSSPSGSGGDGGGSINGGGGGSASGEGTKIVNGMIYNGNGQLVGELGLETPLIDPIDIFAGFLAGNLVGYRAGYELTVGKNFRLAPWGNRTGNPYGELPHYHRRIVGPNGKVIDGGSLDWHRPWQKGW